MFWDSKFHYILVLYAKIDFSSKMLTKKFTISISIYYKHLFFILGITKSPQSPIVIANSDNKEVIILNNNYNLVRKIFCKPLNSIADVAYFKRNIYICDSERSQILVLNNEGNIIAKYGRLGEGNGELKRPNGIAVDSQGRVIVSDSLNHRVKVCLQRCSFKKGVLRNFAKFTGKHLCQSLFFNKVAGLRPATLLEKKETLAQVFSWEFYEIYKNTFFTEHLCASASMFGFKHFKTNFIIS